MMDGGYRLPGSLGGENAVQADKMVLVVGAC